MKQICNGKCKIRFLLQSTCSAVWVQNMRPCVFILTDSLATTLNFARRIHTRTMTESNVARWTSQCQKLPFAGRTMKRKKSASSVHLEGSNRGGSGADALSVLCFVPCFYLHRIIYFPYIPRTNARYKAVRGAADISTQAGSLETFELLARRAGGVWGGGVVVATALSGVVQGCERETRGGFGGRDGDGGAASRG